MAINNSSVMRLRALVFDEISFKRTGMESMGEPSFQFKFGFREENGEDFTAIIRIEGENEGEFSFAVQASGHFTLAKDADMRNVLMRKNAAAIIFPYVRSQISVLTAQPGMEPIVLPPMNVGQMVEDAMAKARVGDGTTGGDGDDTSE